MDGKGKSEKKIAGFPVGDSGILKISEDVVGVIAGIAANEVEGVAGMSGGLVGDIGEILGKKSLSKGVKVDIEDGEAAIDLYLIIEFGMKIPNVAQKVQESCKQAVETMTGLVVTSVNVHVQGVTMPGEELVKE